MQRISGDTAVRQGQQHAALLGAARRRAAGSRLWVLRASAGLPGLLCWAAGAGGGAELAHSQGALGGVTDTMRSCSGRGAGEGSTDDATDQRRLARCGVKATSDAGTGPTQPQVPWPATAHAPRTVVPRCSTWPPAISRSTPVARVSTCGGRAERGGWPGGQAEGGRSGKIEAPPGGAATQAGRRAGGRGMRGGAASPQTPSPPGGAPGSAPRAPAGVGVGRARRARGGG